MKGKRILIDVLVVGCLVLCVTPLPKICVSAGMSRVALSDSESLFFEDAAGNYSLNKYSYIIGNSGVIYANEDGRHCARFTKDAGNSDILLFSEFPEVSDIGEGKVTLETNLLFSLNELKGEKEFGVMFGVQRLDSVAKSDGSGWLYFRANAEGNGFEYGLNSYEGGTETEIVGETPLGSGEEISVHIEQFFDGSYTIAVNEVSLDVKDSALPVSLIGFASAGTYTDVDNYVDATIYVFDVINTFYTVADTTVLHEDFEAGVVNAEEWYLNGLGIGIADGKLNFQEAGRRSFIATRYKYSNFQMSFDLTDLKREPTYREDGKLLRAASSSFLMAYGLDVENPESLIGFESASQVSGGRWTRFDGNVVGDATGKSSGETRVGYNRVDSNYITLPDRYNLWNPVFDGRTANIRIRVEDGQYTLSMKWADETKYYTVVEFDLGLTPYGYILLGGGWTHADTNKVDCSIDNLEIINLDVGAELVKVGYTPSGLINNGDYDYVDLRDPSFLLGKRGNTAYTDGEFPGIQTAVTAVLLVGAIASGIGIGVMISGKDKRKGGRDE